jgi:hypothetical protein
MTVPFPAGVADPARGVAFLRLAGDEIVAVDLTNGEVKWRAVGLGRPIGAVTEGLVTIARGRKGIDVSVVDAASGRAKKQVRAVPIPAWVADELDRTDGFAATAVERNGAIEVAWKARQLYREGAPPSHNPSGRAEVPGHFVIPAGGRRAVDASTVHANAARAPDFSAPMEATLGEHVYALDSVVKNSEVSVMLKARHQPSGSVLWEREIKRLAQSRPPPLRM